MEIVNNLINNIFANTKKSSDEKENEKNKIYILELENNKYYVEKTSNIDSCFLSHTSGSKSEWTKLYKPLKVLEQYDCCSNYDEKLILLESMKRFGIDNVRGCSVQQLTLTTDEKIKLEKQIILLANKCFKCKSTDHFVKDCPISNFPVVKNNMKNKKNRKLRKYKKDDMPCVICHICKKIGHFSTECPNINI